MGDDTSLFDDAAALLRRVLLGADDGARAQAATVKSVDSALSDLRRQVTRAGLAGFMGVDTLDTAGGLGWTLLVLLVLGILLGVALLVATAVSGGFATRTLFAADGTGTEQGFAKAAAVAFWAMLALLVLLSARVAWRWTRTLVRQIRAL